MSRNTEYSRRTLPYPRPYQLPEYRRRQAAHRRRGSYIRAVSAFPEDIPDKQSNVVPPSNRMSGYGLFKVLSFVMIYYHSS